MPDSTNRPLASVVVDLCNAGMDTTAPTIGPKPLGTTMDAAFGPLKGIPLRTTPITPEVVVVAIGQLECPSHTCACVDGGGPGGDAPATDVLEAANSPLKTANSATERVERRKRGMASHSLLKLWHRTMPVGHGVSLKLLFG